VQTHFTLDLNISGPLIVLPSDKSGDQQIVFSLGEMMVNLPRTCLAENPSVFAILEKISISCVVIETPDDDEDNRSPQKTAIQVLAPTAIELNLSLGKSIQLDVTMSENISFRVSPETIRIMRKFIHGVQHELDSIPAKVGVSVDLSSSSSPVGDGDDSNTPSNSLPFNAAVVVVVKKFEIVFSDGAVDVVSFETSVPSLTLSLAETGDLSATMECVRVIARNYNPRGGGWEPILEPSYFSGFFQITSEDITARVRAVSAVNTVITMGLVRSALWIQSTLFEEDVSESSTGKRFRIVNSTTCDVYVSIIRTSGRPPKILHIKPSSTPTYIDHWVLAYAAREVFVSLKIDHKILAKYMLGGGKDILRVPLDRGYSETFVNDSIVQSISMGDSSTTSSRCVLISYENFFFNQCDVPLVVKGLGRSQTVPTPLSYLIGVPSLVGAGTVKTVSTVSSIDEQSKLKPDCIVLQPGTFITISKFPETEFSVGNSDFFQEKISLDLADFSRRAPLTEPPNFLANIDCGRGFNVRMEGSTNETDYPHRGNVRQIFFKPPLVVSNATPCSIRLSHSGKRSVFSLQPGEYRNVHDLEAVDEMTKMGLNLSFINIESEWSKTMFGPFAAAQVSTAAANKGQPLLVRDESQSPRADTAAGVVKSKKLSRQILKLEERYLLSPELNRVHPVHLTATSTGSQAVTVSIKWWLIDRTGLNLTVYGTNSLPLPRGDNNGPVWLLPDPDTPINLKIFRGRSDYVQVTLPDSGWFDAKIGNYPVVFVSRETFVEKFVEIVPKYTVFNGLIERSIFITNCISDVMGDEDVLPPNTGTVLMSDSFKFSVEARANPQSVSIPLRENFAGVWPLDVDGSGNVVRVEIAPDCGSICVSIFPGSSVVVRNEKRKHAVEILVDNGNFFEIPPLTEQPVGWRDPFTHPRIETTMRVLGDYFGGPHQFNVPLARAGDDRRYGGCVNVIPADDPQSIVIVVEKSHRDSQQYSMGGRMDEPPTVAPTRIVRIEFEAQSVSASIVHQNKEVIYAEISLMKFLILQDNVLRRVSLMLSDIQVDTCVSRKPTSNPVILVNRGNSSRAFLEFTLDQNTNVSYGVSMIPLLSVQLDTLVIEVDSKFMIALDDLVNELMTITGVRGDAGRKSAPIIVPGSEILPVKKGTVIPLPAPPILILDTFEISQISVKLWVDFALKTMGFMPVSLKLVIGVLSLGDSFKLDGASVAFNRRNVTAYKGSLIQFKDSIVGDFVDEALRNMAALLGSSSLLAIPRAPIHLISNVGAFGLEKATRAVGGIGDFISNWTSDSQYRDAQAKIRKNKNIQGISDGFIEGATRLSEGAEGMLDIFRKPVEGAKAHGCVGCLKGFGKGIVGTIFKPITKVGEAVSDVGTGIVRTVKPGSSSKRPVLERRRVPRPLYGISRSYIADYIELDAVVFSKLSKDLTKGIELILPVTIYPNSCASTSALILYVKKLLVVQLIWGKSGNMNRQNSQSFRSAVSSNEESGATGSTATTSHDQSKIIAVSLEREIALSDLRSATAAYHSNSIIIEDKFGVELSLRIGMMSAILIGAIEAAVAAATAAERDYVDWSEVKGVFRDVNLEAHDKATLEAAQLDDGEHGITKKVEVFEVERFLMTYGWTTPYMALDSGNEAWRWLDKTMCRHTKIRPQLARREAARAKLPPISVGNLWKALDEWAIVIDEATTDSNGWQYAISFNSSTWYARPGITASVRRRKWVRHYS